MDQKLSVEIPPEHVECFLNAINIKRDQLKVIQFHLDSLGCA